MSRKERKNESCDSRFSETVNTSDADLKPILGKLFDLHVSSVLEKNLAWFLIAELLENSQVGFYLEVFLLILCL